MITATARKHVVRALRDALRIREGQAREILTTIRNDNALRLLGDTDMRTVKALVSDGCSARPTIGLYVDGGEGYEYTGVELGLTTADTARWNVLGLEEAYEIAAEVHANRGPLMRAADDRMAAEAANDAWPVDTAPVREPRDWTWTNGKVIRADVASSDDHVVVLVELADGTRSTMSMLPLFSGVDGLLQYALSRVGIQARLCVGRFGVFDACVDVPAGVDRSMPTLDMIVEERDVPGLVSLYRRAA